MKLLVEERISEIELMVQDVIKGLDVKDIELGDSDVSSDDNDVLILDTSCVDWQLKLKKKVEKGVQVIVSSFNICNAPTANNLGAKGFLLRPFDLNEMDMVFRRCYNERVSVNRDMTGPLEKSEERLMGIGSSEGIAVVREKDILRIEADKNYSVVYLLSGDKIISSKTLKHFELILDADRFIRVHKSHLVNLSKINWIETLTGSRIRLENGDFIPVARRKKSYLISNLQII